MREGHTPFTVIGDQQVTSIVSAVPLTVPAGCVAALIQAEGQACRWRKGADPTAAVGQRLLVTEQPTFLPFAPHDVRVIQESATGKVNVVYFGQ